MCPSRVFAGWIETVSGRSRSWREALWARFETKSVLVKLYRLFRKSELREISHIDRM